MDIRKTTPPPRFEVPKASQGEANVLVILLDNLGFGAPKTFGGPVTMPTLDRLATEGVIYNNFHAAPLCSPQPHGGVADRPQPTQRQLRVYRGNGE